MKLKSKIETGPLIALLRHKHCSAKPFPGFHISVIKMPQTFLTRLIHAGDTKINHFWASTHGKTFLLFCHLHVVTRQKSRFTPPTAMAVKDHALILELNDLEYLL